MFPFLTDELESSVDPALRPVLLLEVRCFVAGMED